MGGQRCPNFETADGHVCCFVKECQGMAGDRTAECKSAWNEGDCRHGAGFLGQYLLHGQTMPLSVLGNEGFIGEPIICLTRLLAKRHRGETDVPLPKPVSW